ncbi:MAG: YtxH domain-containing protein, partial [Gemmatimonadota bacterium]|nr:YtxH domain-containing protein [Gemmatimonadota bacterium]
MEASEEDEVTTAGRGDMLVAGVPGFAAGMVAGVLLGAGLALLLAPNRGSRTRRRLSRRLQRLRENAAEGLDRAGTRSRRQLQR